MAQPTTARPRIAAGTMVFNSWDIALAAVTNLVNQGITDFYIVDHRSTGEPSEEFARRIPASARIHWFRKESAYFSQATVMTALANLARQDGFDAFIPFDSDEFFQGIGKPLVESITTWLTESSTRSLRCEMVNFFQSRDVENFTPESLAHARYSAVSGELPLESLLDRNQEFRRFPFSVTRYKAIMRLVSGPDGDLDWVSNGNHHVTNVGSGDAYPSTTSSTIVVLHLPYPSARGIVARRGIALRKPHRGAFTVNTNDSEYSMADDDRMTEWELASVPADATDESIHIGGVSAVHDDRLASLAPAISAAIRPANSKPVPVIDESARIAAVALDLAMVALDLTLSANAGSAANSPRDGVQRETLRSYRQLERRVVKLQAQVDELRPNLLRILLRKFRGR